VRVKLLFCDLPLLQLYPPILHLQMLLDLL
jgi:hypothetical protein